MEAMSLRGENEMEWDSRGDGGTDRESESVAKKV